MTAHPLIERAARMLCVEGCRGDCSGGSCGENWRDEIQPARAVVLDLLAALEEPTEAMWRAGDTATPVGYPITGPVWRAMLSALRTEITAQDKGE